jgi:hypothetical protein
VTRASFVILGVLLLSGTLVVAARAEVGLCVPWASEIDPLPRVSDPDPLRTAWAELRADRLAEAAWKLEPRSRALAHRVWRHASCLDPERLDFVHAITRTAPVRWARPPILGVDELQLRKRDALPEPVSEWSWDLGEPIRVVVTRIPPPERSREVASERSAPPSRDATEQIAAAEKALREARFELALERVEGGRRFLGPEGAVAELPGQRAQLEVLAATAEIALGQEVAARESLERALRAQPELRLDPALHSPKLVDLFEEVRGGDGPPQ